MIALRAVLELEYVIEGWPTHAPSSPIEPRLLVTFTMRAAGAVSSQGRKALMTETTANTMAGAPLTTPNCNSNMLPKFLFMWYC